MISETTIKNRTDQLKAMDVFMHSINDEELIDEWLTYGVPDEACEEQIIDIAEDDEAYKDCIKIFQSAVQNEDCYY